MINKLNKNQTLKLKKLISQHIHEILNNDRAKADTILKKIKKYGVKNIPEAIELYKGNRKTLYK